MHGGSDKEKKHVNGYQRNGEGAQAAQSDKDQCPVSRQLIEEPGKDRGKGGTDLSVGPGEDNTDKRFDSSCYHSRCADVRSCTQERERNEDFSPEVGRIPRPKLVRP